jgi:hypothetical protein
MDEQLEAILRRFRELGHEVTEADIPEMQVGPLGSWGIGSTLGAARAEAAARSGKWGANHGKASITLTSQEGELMVLRGAQRVPMIKP